MDYFVVIGAQKAGTSWLHRQLRRHPEVHLPRWKELHYFDVARPPYQTNFTGWFLDAARKALAQERYEWVDNLLEVAALPYTDNDGTAYRAYLERGVKPRSRIVGEITPAYAILDESGFQHMHDVLAGPRVVFLMRDPVERLWSQARMRGREPDAEALQRPVLAPANWARCDYRQTITRLESVFPPELIHYGFYEDLFTADALGGIADFFGVSRRWDWDFDERVRKGTDVPLREPGAALLDQLLPVYEFVRGRFGDRVPATWRH